MTSSQTGSIPKMKTPHINKFIWINGLCKVWQFGYDIYERKNYYEANTDDTYIEAMSQGKLGHW